MSSTPRVSITLPSIYPELLRSSLQALYANAAGVDLEVIVVSPFEVGDARVVWVPETQAKGNCAAHQLAYQHSTGEVVIALSDDFLLEPGCIREALNFLEAREKRAFPYACGLHEARGSVGTAYGIYYPYFPVMRRSSIEYVGGWLDPAYQSHFADVDLAMRVWAMGGRCELSELSHVLRVPDRLTLPESAHKASAKQADLAHFVERWGELYGRGWGHQLRDFNLDVSWVFLPALMEDHSLYMNDPRFISQIKAVYDELNHDYQKWG